MSGHRYTVEHEGRWTEIACRERWVDQGPDLPAILVLDPRCPDCCEVGQVCAECREFVPFLVGEDVRTECNRCGAKLPDPRHWGDPVDPRPYCDGGR